MEYLWFIKVVHLLQQSRYTWLSMLEQWTNCGLSGSKPRCTLDCWLFLWTTTYSQRYSTSNDLKVFENQHTDLLIQNLGAQ